MRPKSSGWLGPQDRDHRFESGWCLFDDTRRIDSNQRCLALLGAPAAIRRGRHVIAMTNLI